MPFADVKLTCHCDVINMPLLTILTIDIKHVCAITAVLVVAEKRKTFSLLKLTEGLLKAKLGIVLYEGWGEFVLYGSETCIMSVVLYGSDTWAVKEEDLAKLEWNDKYGDTEG